MENQKIENRTVMKNIEDRMMTSNIYLIIEVLEGEKELGRTIFEDNG